jgi:predicted metal-dependent hydrolase
MATRQVTVPDIGPVTLYKRRNSRSIRLSIAPDGEVRVSMPYWVPFRSGINFATSKAEWIRSMRSRSGGQKEVRHGQAIGKAHHLYFRAHTGQKIATRQVGTEIHILHPMTVTPDHPAVQQAAVKAGIRALRKEAEQLLPQRIRQLAERDGFIYTSVSVKQLKSRWGSCDSRKNIVLNLFLMQLPWQLIDYVLWHELTHTRVMRHGPPFWDEMERHVAGARGLGKEVHTYQPALKPKDEPFMA